MYVNKIDNLLDDTINNFYVPIMNSKEFEKYINEINFVKYQLEINKIFVDITKKIDKKKIYNILEDEDHTNKIIEIIKKYLAYYTMLTIAFFIKVK